MSDKASETVELVIGGRKYPVRTSVEDKERLRSIADSINKALLDIQLQYSDRDQQDCLAMVLLQRAVQLQDASDKLIELEESVSKVL